MFSPSDEPREARDQAEGERRRRSMLLRMGMVMCLALVLMDSNNRAHSPPGTPNAKSLPEEQEQLRWSPRVADQVRAATAQLLGVSRQNVTGLFKGLSNGEHSLVQLKSLPIAGMDSVQFVYGVMKVFGITDKSKDALLPLQGLFVSAGEDTGFLTLLGMPFFNERLAVQVAVSLDNATDHLDVVGLAPTRKLAQTGEEEGGRAEFAGARLLRRFLEGIRRADTRMLDPLTEAPDWAPRPARRLLGTRNSSQPLVTEVRGAAGVRLVTYASPEDLAVADKLVADPSHMAAYQQLTDELMSPSFRNILHPSVRVPHCDFVLSLRVSFSDRLAAPPANKLATEIEGAAAAANCDGFNVTVSSILLTAELLDRKIQMYVTILILVCIAQIFCFVSLLKHAGAAGALGKVSILCLGSQALLDSLLCIVHLMLCAAHSRFTAHFLSVAALELLLFSVFGMRCVVAVYQARYAQEFAAEGSAGLRQRLALLHAKFYAALIAVMLVMYTSGVSLPLLLFLYSVWVPQIVFSAVSGTRNALNYVYLFGTALSRLVVPAYVLGCPKNMFAIVFDGMLYAPSTCLALFIWTAIQLLVIVLQDQLGPRFFVPKALLPVRYNYHRALPQSMVQLPSADPECANLPECVICYCAVDTEPSGGGYMLTPCEHVFHEPCLSRWMEVKLECPVCRASLPSVE